MKKSIALVAFIGVFSLTNSVFAQTYAAVGGGTVSVNGCTTISQDLVRGSTDVLTGGDVSRLQTFLVAQNYPGGGSWMITGYFGAATQQAVMNFQRQRGLVQTGAVDASTRAAMGINCGIASSYIPSTNNTPYVAFNSPYVNYVSSNQCGYGSANCSIAGRPSINYMTPQTGAVGTMVTIYGTGFSRTGNAVHFGPGVIANVMSVDGTSISFTVPSQLYGYGSGATVLGSYNVSVTDAAGNVSNQIPFTVNSLTNGGLPGISVVNPPTTLATGAAGTWTVLMTGNNVLHTITVRWGDESTTGAQPTTQSFTLTSPQTLSFTHAYAQAGTYTVSFTLTNNLGAQYTTSTVVSVSGAATNGGAPVLASIAPAQGRPGSLVVLQGANFAPSGNKVHFGTGGSANVSSTNNGTVIYYTIPYVTSTCDLSGSACNGTSVTNGSYPISIETGGGTSSSLSFTVTL